MNSWKHAERALRLLGLRRIERDTLEQKMNIEIDRVKAKYVTSLAALDRKTAAIERQLEAFCDAHRADMMPTSRKDDAGLVYKSAWGKLAWRKCPPAIEFTVKKLEKVLAALKAQQLTECIRTVEEPNKDVLLSLSDAQLATVHCRKKPGEKFEAKPDYTAIIHAEAETCPNR